MTERQDEQRDLSRSKSKAQKEKPHDEMKEFLVTKRAMEKEEEKKKEGRRVWQTRGKPQPTMSTRAGDWLEINLPARFSCY